ncbi:hypothetical protein CYMTET_20548 [Cymbomonas tetramitiformis]|uniref:YABBY protein C-terminal domain-containing protein n=1 Tax=Cymbomonas tetramitiformis TaxID=36881 RepID=A0AAE0G4J0_9CHLO|nr:hypothetical protein CYMTET_20548 [Cymbomonas tetramitiformis]
MLKISEGFEGLGRAFESLSGDPTFGLSTVNSADVAVTKGKGKKSRKKYDEEGNEIKRAPTRYNQFVKDNMKSVKAENQGLSASEVFKALASKWHAVKGEQTEKEGLFLPAAPQSTTAAGETAGGGNTEKVDGESKKKKKRKLEEDTVEEGADVDLKKEKKKKKKKKDKEAKDK